MRPSGRPESRLGKPACQCPLPARCARDLLLLSVGRRCTFGRPQPCALPFARRRLALPLRRRRFPCAAGASKPRNTMSPHGTVSKCPPAGRRPDTVMRFTPILFIPIPTRRPISGAIIPPDVTSGLFEVPVRGRRPGYTALRRRLLGLQCMGERPFRRLFRGQRAAANSMLRNCCGRARTGWPSRC